MPEDELTALLALNRIDGLGCTGARFLYEQLGSAKEIFKCRDHLKELIPGVRQSLIEALDCSGYYSFVREELDFINRHGISCITFADEEYPARLKDCMDAPLVLFKMGNANLNALHMVSIVGTRKATEYGLAMCGSFVRELHRLCPDIVIISGLAYGIDIQAHKSALADDCCTIGVLGHGLDMIYPASHRSVAKSMLEKGALVTEFMSRTVPLRNNFVRRNRIIAGLADATVIVESKAKGGSLITAEIAESYNRDCFAFPGSVGDPCSVGCNELIRTNRAGLITSAEDFLSAMNWMTGTGSIPVQKQLFPDLSEEESKVYERIRLRAHGVHLNTIIVDCNIPYVKLTSILFTLEMKGLISALPGSVYKSL